MDVALPKGFNWISFGMGEVRIIVAIDCSFIKVFFIAGRYRMIITLSEYLHNSLRARRGSQ